MYRGIKLSEEEVEKIKKENDMYLDWFDKWLKAKELTEKTIKNHVLNVDFFINEYVCYHSEETAINGYYKISSFLGDWFIRKALWSSCAYIKSMAASIKKFYNMLMEKGVFKKDDYKDLCEIIKEEMPDWLDEMKKYDDLSEDDFLDYF